MSVQISDPASSQQKTPVKRKRGRPPKANKPEDAFPTFTMQLETSPLCRSPNAELTSSQVVKIGEPNSFMPMMKVLPSPIRKKRRKSSNFSLPLQPPRPAKIDELLAPISRAYVTSLADNSLHNRVLDNLSAIVKERPHDTHASTLSHDVSLRPGILLLVTGLPERFIDSAPPHTEALQDPLRNSVYNTQVSVQELLWGTNLYKDVRGDVDPFGFELIIDENGQATLADRQRGSLSSIQSYKGNNSSEREQAQILTEQVAQFANRLGSAGSSLEASERAHLLPVLKYDEAAKTTGFDVNNYVIPHFVESPKVEMNHGDFHHPYTEFGNSLSHMTGLHRHTINKPSQLPQQNEVISLKKSDPFDRFSVDTLDLVIEEQNTDFVIESADARSALRKVIRR